jgi:hypothetical protein
MLVYKDYINANATYYHRPQISQFFGSNQYRTKLVQIKLYFSANNKFFGNHQYRTKLTPWSCFIRRIRRNMSLQFQKFDKIPTSFTSLCKWIRQFPQILFYYANEENKDERLAKNVSTPIESNFQNFLAVSNLLVDVIRVACSFGFNSYRLLLFLQCCICIASATVWTVGFNLKWTTCKSITNSSGLPTTPARFIQTKKQETKRSNLHTTKRKTRKKNTKAGPTSSQVSASAIAHVALPRSSASSGGCSCAARLVDVVHDAYTQPQPIGCSPWHLEAAPS